MVIKFLRRPKASISLDVEGEEFHPGDFVRCRAVITSQKGFDVRKCRLVLACVETYWQTTSDGKTTSQVKRTGTITEVEHRFVRIDRIRPGISHIEEAVITLPPDAPSTVIGRHARLDWMLKLSLDVKGARDLKAERSFTVNSVQDPSVSPGNRSMVETMQSFDDCDLGLEIARTEYRAGDSVQGRLRLESKGDCDFPEVRVEIVRQEKAGVRGSSTVADQAVLETNATYSSGRTRQWGFSLVVPDGRWPSTEVSRTLVSWRVKAVLARSRRRDFSVEREITVY
jgi:hypothetical protein